jgi:hypothetical protein
MSAYTGRIFADHQSKGTCSIDGCRRKTCARCANCKLYICGAHSTSDAWRDHYTRPNCAGPVGAANGNAQRQQLGIVRAKLLQGQHASLNWSSDLEIDGVVLSRAAFLPNPFCKLPTFNGMKPKAIIGWLNTNRPLGGSNSWRIKTYSNQRLLIGCDRARTPCALAAQSMPDDGETGDGNWYVSC